MLLGKQQILITKADGNRVPFDESTLRASLRRSGAPQDAVDAITKETVLRLTDGMSTKEIYRYAFSRLQKIKRPTAARYSMKRALLSLGPSGFPFEKFIAEIFKARGFAVRVGEEVAGMCVTHEVDLVATKGPQCIGAEIKFHNRLGLKSDIKDVLYVEARFDDIRKAEGKKQKSRCVTEGWFITNTKLTKNAIKYGECEGLKLLSWGYPSVGNLRDLIEEAGLHPVTALTSLSQNDKTKLLSSDIVLCRNIHHKQEVLLNLGISAPKVEAAVKEATALCRLDE